MSSKRNHRKKKNRRTRNSLQFEALEDRRMLAMLGLVPEQPELLADSPGTVVYDSATDLFSADATPDAFFLETMVPFPLSISAPSSFDLNFFVDNNGDFSSGVAGDDFVLTGEIDINFDGTIDVSGVLLTGEVLDFGFQDSGSASSTDSYDVRLAVTGGELATAGFLSGGDVRPNYFDGKDIALLIGSENSTFTGSFDVDFNGGNKSLLGPTDPIPNIPSYDPQIDIIKYVDKYVTETEMTTVDFEGLAAGEIVSNQIPGFVVNGVNARVPGAGNRAMVFDSSNPTGGDYDLGSPSSMNGGPGMGSGGLSNQVALGNILIISEDGDASDPDDEAYGGSITFTFDQPVTINYLDVLDIDNDEWGGSVVTLTTDTGTQTIGIPTGGNNSWQQLSVNIDNVTEMSVNFVSSGAISEFKYTTTTLEKKWFDANEAPGVDFMVGETVEFSYHVTNPGDTNFEPVIVMDDNATPGDTSDDFYPDPILVDNGSGDFFNVGDTNEDSWLNPGEEWIYTASIIATVEGQFTNIGSVTGTPINDDGDVVGDDLIADDPGNYNVIGTPGISIEKWTNGVDADTPGEAAEIAPGDTVTWTYWVENTGSSAFTLDQVDVSDDNGTPGDTSDDFAPILVTGSDVGSDGILSPGETWEYTAETVAQTIVSGNETSVFHFNGYSSTSGSYGNIRGFSVDGVSVNTSAFSRNSSGTWDDAYLGIYSGGLGVTDSGEGDGGYGRHRVDNSNRNNYVVFEFSENVIFDRAFLDSVVNDSDLSIWYGTIDGAFGNHVSLTDAVLDGLFNEVNNTSSSMSRWADFNSGEMVGNYLVLAASTVDSHQNDNFKIRKLQFQQLSPGVYSNVAIASAFEVTASDVSHYRNPAPAPTGQIGNFVWNDVDRDGRQDLNEVGIEGVTVRLFGSNGDVIATTLTDGDGLYEFSGLAAGDYFVEFVAPTDFIFSPQGQGWGSGSGSQADVNTGLTGVITLADQQIDKTVDAGMYESMLDYVFEAEDFEWSDHPWKVHSSGSTSGGHYIKSDNGTGSYYNDVPSNKTAKYQVHVSESGRYELSGLIQARNSWDNSLWVKINDAPWVQWHMDVTGSDNWEWQNVTDGWHRDAKSFQLESGMNSLKIKIREDGTKIDKFMVSRLATTTVVIDATDFDSALGSWQVETDDDGNEFLVAPNGTGTHYAAPSTGDVLSYDFSVQQTGQYEVHALVSALNGNDNSFWVAIDDSDWVQWHLSVTDGAWQWQTATDGSYHETVFFDLETGDHTLKISVREDGTKLDKIVITNDMDLDLDSL